MKRTFIGRVGASNADSQGEQGFWPSYADMMSAVALILFFLMLLSYIQNLITGNNLETKERELAATQTTLQDTLTRLSSTQLALTDAENALAEMEDTLAITRKDVETAQDQLAKITIDLAEAKLTLTEQQTELDKQKEDLAAQDKLLSEQSKLLGEQEALIGTQEAALEEAREALLDMQGTMQTIAVLRLSILEQIRDSFVRATGDSSRVSIADNGNIILNESILFDVGSSEIKSEAKDPLDQLVNVFYKFLSDSENIKYVDSIVISGHTDSTGSQQYNRALSTDRANSVLDYLLSSGDGKLQRYAKYFCAAGYGETRPVDTNKTAEGRSANRRIEISIILKDDTILEIVETYLKELPENIGH